MAYDVKKVTVIVDGVFLTGFSENKKVSAKREEENHNPHISVDGEVEYSANHNDSGIISIPLKSTSPSIRYLNQLANERKIFPVSVVDLNTNGTNASGSQAVVQNPVLPEKGNKITEAEFEIHVGKLTIE